MTTQKRTTQETQIDAASKICARTFEAISIAGIVFLIIGLVLYVTGVVPPLVPMPLMEKLWQYKPSVFWEKISQQLNIRVELGSYLWIFKYIAHSDMIAMIGVLVFILGVVITLVGLCAAYAAKRDTKVLIISIIVLLITLYAILGYV